MLANAEDYRQTIQKALDYIVSQMNPDGSVNPTEKGFSPTTSFHGLWHLAAVARRRRAWSGESLPTP